jgi:prepilin-type N-terminal cleavage/methylation domain-containing protein
MNKAFTLVELAIVIVIIGLLVGGVLTGQELIKQAKLRSLMKEIISYETAVITFKGKYNYLPGDLPNATQLLGYTCTETPPSPKGDGRIQWDYVHACGGEQSEAWRHLSLSKLIKGSYPGYCIVSAGCSLFTNKYFPASTAFNNTYFHMQWNRNLTNYSSAYSQHSNYLTFSGARSQSANAWQILAPALSQGDAKQVEDKLDNGVPASGKLLVTKSHYYQDGTNTGTDTLCVDASNNFYDLASDTPECVLNYKLD